MKIKLLLAALLFLLLAGAAVWYFYFRVKPIKTTEEALQVLTETPLPGTDVPSNPLGGKVPELNPLDKTNPFKDVYKNPFTP